jgi:3-hydroxyacyl-CoA dehydrogenase / 3-hydroxy-2-methylbutyryl-CoA dehydrogenase
MPPDVPVLKCTAVSWRKRRATVRVSDCIAVVTGGASGLGEACVRELAGAGAKVAIFDLAVDRGEKLAAELGDRIVFARADVTSDESVQDAIGKTVAAFGGLNAVINCAGIGVACKALTKKGPMPLAEFNRVVQINLVGTFNVIRLALAQMVKNTPNDQGERGVIINTASAAAFDGQVGQPAYSASKAGVVGMTLPLARECADYGVRVMTIAPGLFNTPMLALLPEAVREALGKMVPFPQRLGQPSEYAMLARHIIENPMLNGEVIRLDGAIRMAPK